MTRRWQSWHKYNTIQGPDGNRADLQTAMTDGSKTSPRSLAYETQTDGAIAAHVSGIDSATSDRADTAARTDGAKTAGILWPV